MDKKKLKWYAILAAAAIAATLLFPIVIREGSGWIAGKILENAGLETETGEEPETERPSGDGTETGQSTGERGEKAGETLAGTETAEWGAYHFSFFLSMFPPVPQMAQEETWIRKS